MMGIRSLTRNTRWIRRGFNRGFRIISFGLAIAGTVVATVETMKAIHNSDNDRFEGIGDGISVEEMHKLKQ